MGIRRTRSFTMRLRKLRVQNLRCLTDVDMSPGPHVNVLTGPNGAGKTSVLEAIYLLSRARSFRRGPASSLVRHGLQRLELYGEVTNRRATHRIGLAYSGGCWQARMDGRRTDRLSDLVRSCAVVYFGPDSHALIVGPADERRRFMDWGVFHVEHEFLDHWRRYRKALRQRNALLRADVAPSDAAMTPWEREMDAASGPIHEMRARYLERLEHVLQALAERLQPELGAVSLRYRRGWNNEQSLSEVLASQRGKDRIRGYTGVGIHRADWQPAFAQAAERIYLSRGQQKACAFALHLAQAKLYADDYTEWPVMCMDDLLAELDEMHREAVIGALKMPGMQVFVTGTDFLGASADLGDQCVMFHVEHGRLVRTDGG